MVKGRRRNKERTIKIIIVNGNISILQQRAEGGGQILKNVGNNANQGGQTAVKGRTANFKSQFANGNGRSGIAGKRNDEQGGQSAIKINKSIKINKKVKRKKPRR